MSKPYLAYSRRHHAEPIPGTMALEVRDLCVRYPDADALALDRITLQIPCGARVGLVGPNGAGKSTLLKAIAGVVPRSSGEVSLYGQAPGTCHHQIAHLPQTNQVDWRFPIPVRKLILTGRYVHLGWLSRPGAHDVALVTEVMERMGLTALAERQIGQLSGGQQQRVLLARALVQGADLLLLDEPLNGVDAETRAVVSDVLQELRRQGKTVVVAMHDLGRLDTAFDGAVYLSEGHVVQPPPGSLIGLPIGQEA
jgi:ABC-type Mn2+/Zn2+ transport system ATPase subunit